MYFDLGYNKEERKFKTDKQGKSWNKFSQFFHFIWRTYRTFQTFLRKKTKLTGSNYYICWNKIIKLHLNYYICWNKIIKLHLEFKRILTFCQQQCEAFSTSPPETSYFSLLAYHFYAVTVHIQHQTQKFCHLFCSGWVSAAGADDWLWQKASVASQCCARGTQERACMIERFSGVSIHEFGSCS